LPTQEYNGDLDNLQEGELCWKKQVVIKHGTHEGAFLIGYTFNGTNFHVATSCAENEDAAFRNRVVGKRDKPNDKNWQEVWVVAQELMKSGHNVQPMTFVEWVSAFQGSKKQMLIDCYESLLGRIPAKKILKRYSCFIKREIKLAYIAWNCQKWITPRNIMSATDVVKIILGPYFRAYSKYCHNILFTCNDPIYYEPGGSADEVSLWLHQNLAWELIENDFSRFDRSNGLQSTKLKIYFAMCLGLKGKELYVYNLLQEKSKFTSRHGVQCVRVPGTLSGHPDTTWSNTMINLTVQWYCIVKTWHLNNHPKLTFQEAFRLDACPKPGRDFRLCACGDDMIGRCKRQYIDNKQFAAVGTLLGHKMKIKTGHTLQQARFCSNAFYPVKGTDIKIMAPTLKCLLKMGATIKHFNFNDTDAVGQHMRGVALGLLKQTNHVPLLNDYIQTVLRNTTGKKGKILNEAISELNKKYRQINESYEESAESELWLAQMYAINLGTIQQLRTEINAMSTFGIYSSTAIDELVQCVARVEDLG